MALKWPQLFQIKSKTILMGLKELMDHASLISKNYRSNVPNSKIK
jgi:hypothetical protein